MDYKELAKAIRKFRQSKNVAKQGHSMIYSDWYDYRICLSHQMATRADEKWFSTQIGGETEGTGKQMYEPFGKKMDLGDVYCGNSLLPGINNIDLKVSFKEKKNIDSIGFQQYRPADPIAFYAAFMGVTPKDYVLIMVPKDVAFKMKLNKIVETEKLGSAHGTGIYDSLTIEDKLKVMEDARSSGKSCVLSFDIKKSQNKDDFELLMDKFRMKLDDVKDFVLNYKFSN